MPEPVVKPKMYLVSISRQEFASSARATLPHKRTTPAAQSAKA
jgi:hypothetical protein